MNRRDDIDATSEKRMLSLASQVQACRLCQDAGYLSRANPIRPAVLADPRLLLIGQAPGPVTDARGYHFAGPAGRLLEKWLLEAGFPEGYFRRHVHLSSLTRCFPGKATSGSGDRPPSRQEQALCRAYLEAELQILPVPVVLLVGKMAIDTFLPRRPLGESIGKAYRFQERTFLPLPHASGVSRWLNDPANRLLVSTALRELSRLREALGLDQGLA